MRPPVRPLLTAVLCLTSTALAGSSSLIASEQDHARSLAQDAHAIFWLTDEGVMRADKSGGASRKLYDAPGASDLGVVRDRLVWIEAGTIKTAPVRGGEVKQLVAERIQPERLALDPAAVYWAEVGDDRPALHSVRRTSAQVGELLYPFTMPQDLVADGAQLYFTDLGGKLHRVGKFGGPPEELASDAFAPAGRLGVDDRWIFWTNPSGALVQRVAKTGGRKLKLYQGGAIPSALALGRHELFFAVNDTSKNDHRILRVPKRGGKPKQAAKAEGEITDLLLDGQTLYWIEQTSTGSSIHKANLTR